MSIPLQSNCRVDDPEEHALWAFPGIAGPHSRAPLVLPVDVMRKWSKHLWDCGFRHHPDEQTIKYIPPAPNANWVQGASGRWVDATTPLPPDVTAPDTSHLTDAEKRVLLARLSAEFTAPTAPEGQDGASVDNG